MQEQTSGEQLAIVDRQRFFREIDTPNWARYSYKHEHHEMKDFKNPRYWGLLYKILQPMDMIYCVDANMKRCTLLVEEIDDLNKEVILSVEMEHDFKPMLAEGQKLTYRYRGRGGGHCIVDADGNVVRKELRSKQTALDIIADLQRSEDEGLPDVDSEAA